MSGSNVNLFIENWQWTGADVPCPQATVDLDLQWTDENGDAQQWSGVATFPNDLQLVPVEWVKNELEDLLIRVARHQLGID
jgi:hypothetical protein